MKEMEAGEIGRSGAPASRVLRWAAVVLLLIVVGLVQRSVDRREPRADVPDDLLYIPSGAFLKQAALGYDQAWADLLWLRTIGYYADEVSAAGRFRYLYHMLDVITTLDPRWLYPHVFGGVTLSLDLNRPDLANKLLEKALVTHGDNWRVPFLIGFNAYFGMKDAVTAADYIEKAALLPGSPPYLKGFASRLHVLGGGRDRALQFLKEVMRQTEDPALRGQLEQRYEDILRGRLTGPASVPKGEKPS
jgi:tetratricopeptide (TPR) repeat protein